MIDWSLIGQPVDIGASFRAGWDHTKQIQHERAVDGALAALVQDPTNVEAQNALAGLDRGYATNLIGQRGEAAHRQQIGRILTNPDFAASRSQAREMGDVDLLKQIDGLEDEHKGRIIKMYEFAAPIAYEALKRPYEQRKAFIASHHDQLIAHGWTEEMIANFDPTDKGLNAIVRSNTTLAQARANDEIKWHQAGESPSFATDAMGHPVGSQNPYAGAGNIPPPPPGFVLDDDGGQTASPSGNF